MCLCVCKGNGAYSVCVCEREREEGEEGRKAEHEGSFLNETMHPSILLSRG